MTDYIRTGEADAFEKLMNQNHNFTTKGNNKPIVNCYKSALKIIQGQQAEIGSLKKQLETEKESSKKLREAVLRQSIDNYEYD